MNWLDFIKQIKIRQRIAQFLSPIDFYNCTTQILLFSFVLTFIFGLHVSILKPALLCDHQGGESKKINIPALPKSDETSKSADLTGLIDEINEIYNDLSEKSEGLMNLVKFLIIVGILRPIKSFELILLSNYRRKLRSSCSFLMLPFAHGTLELSRLSMKKMYIRQKTNHVQEGYIDKIIENNRVTYILGEPGAGKSTICRNILYKYGIREDRKRIPILINLGNCNDKKSLSDLVIDECQDIGFGKAKIVRLLRKGRLFILLDGLDEVTSLNISTFLRKQVRVFTEKYVKCKFVITSRNNLRKELAMQSISSVYNLKELDDTQIHRYLKRFPAVSQDKKEYERLYAKIQSSTRLKKLAGTPYLLSLIAQLSLIRGSSIPETKGELYENVMDKIFRKKKNAKYVRIIGILENMAYRLIDENLPEKKFNKEHLENETKNEWPDLLDDYDYIANLLYEIEESGVLTISRYDYEFAHKTLLEYFAARKIQKEDLLVKLNDDINTWNNVAQTWCNIQHDNVNDFISSIFKICNSIDIPQENAKEKEDAEIRKEKFWRLGIECIAEANKIALTDDIKHILEQSIDLKGSLQKEIENSLALLISGRNEVGRFTFEILKQKVLNDELNKFVIDVLAKSCYRKSIELLLECYNENDYILEAIRDIGQSGIYQLKRIALSEEYLKQAMICLYELDTVLSKQSLAQFISYEDDDERTRMSAWLLAAIIPDKGSEDIEYLGTYDDVKNSFAWIWKPFKKHKKNIHAAIGRIAEIISKTNPPSYFIDKNLYVSRRIAIPIALIERKKQLVEYLNPAVRKELKTIPKEVLGVRKYHWTKLNKREEKEEKFYSYYSSEQFLVSIVIVYFIIMSYAMIIAPLLNPCITSKEIDLIYGVEKQHLKLVFIGILGFLYFAGRYIFRIGEFKDGTPGIDIKENIPLVFALACIIVHQIFIVVLHGSQEMDIGMFIGILMLDVSLLVIGNIIIYSIHREFNSMNPLVKLLNA